MAIINLTNYGRKRLGGPFGFMDCCFNRFFIQIDKFRFYNFNAISKFTEFYIFFYFTYIIYNNDFNNRHFY